LIFIALNAAGGSYSGQLRRGDTFSNADTPSSRESNKSKRAGGREEEEEKQTKARRKKPINRIKEMRNK
jgi:hypothetical protein